jgi:hypothetical protein
VKEASANTAGQAKRVRRNAIRDDSFKANDPTYDLELLSKSARHEAKLITLIYAGNTMVTCAAVGKMDIDSLPDSIPISFRVRCASLLSPALVSLSTLPLSRLPVPATPSAFRDNSSVSKQRLGTHRIVWNAPRLARRLCQGAMASPWADAETSNM